MKKFSIIIPNHNEERIKEIKRLIFILFPKAEIIVSNDPSGKGKGWAIREGIKRATGDVLCFIDGDMEIHPSDIYKLLKHINDYDIVIANKNTKILSLRRKIVSLGYRVFVRLFFSLPINDSQTGLKIWHKYAIPSFVTDGFAFDIEMLSKAHKAGYTIKEVAIEVKMARKVKLKHIWTTLIDTIKVKFL